MSTRKFSHIAMDVALKIFIGFLTTLAVGGILGFIGLWIAGEIDPSNATFGYMG